MAINGGYEKARAVKTNNSRTEVNTDGISKRNKRKIRTRIKNSPLLIIISIFLIVGILGGFFLTKSLTKFEMNDYFVKGTVSAEKDYVVIDMTAHKDALVDSALKANPNATLDMNEVYSSLSLVDKGVTIKFMGIDVSKTVTTKYYYREDISHDITQVSKIDLTVPGVYYIEYTSSHFAFKNIAQIRTIVVTGVEVDG